MGKFLVESSQTVFAALKKMRMALAKDPMNVLAAQSITALEQKFSRLHDQRMRDIHKQQKSEVDFHEWLEWAYEQYAITSEGSSFAVTSHCTTEPGVWKFKSVEEAKLKIEKLVEYKIYDRKRDRGDMAIDLKVARPSLKIKQS